MAKAPIEKSKKADKRRNASVQIDALVGDVLDPVLRKRGFASREIIDRWMVIAPPPYNSQSVPDQLTWRGSAEAGTLVIRCTAGLKLLLSHDAPNIVNAINRYFGYVLVEKIRLSAAPFSPGSPQPRETEPILNTDQRTWLTKTLESVDDDALRAALTRLGEGIVSRNGK